MAPERYDKTKKEVLAMPMTQTQSLADGDRQKKPARRQPAFQQHVLEAMEEAWRISGDPSTPRYKTLEEMKKALEG